MPKLIESEVARRFRADLARQHRRRFIPTFETGAFAADLRTLLGTLEPATLDPRTGLTLLADFYRADARILEACDDSNGTVGDVFRLDASALFGAFATRCDDPGWVSGLLQELVEQDDYGVRDTLLDGAAEFLPATVLRGLADRFWKAATSVGGARSAGRSNLRQMPKFLLVEQVAQQLGDPELFERARRGWSREMGTAACVDIAREWLNAGDPDRAMEWLEKVPPGEQFLQEERDQLLRELYPKLGRQADLVGLLWRRLREWPNSHALDELVAVLGEQERADAVATIVQQLNVTQEFRVSDVAFLLDTGHTGVAVDHLLRLRNGIAGQYWDWLLPLAKRFSAVRQPLAATLLYRALLDDILARANSTLYAHGARYLRQLGELAPAITDWCGVEDHAEYFEGLRQRHRLKRSFWGRVDRSG